MKKRKTKEQKIIDKTFEHIHSLLTTAQQIINGPAEFRFQIHHKLLDMIPMVEIVLDANGFTRTDEVVKRIKAVAELVAPTTNLECFK